MIVIISIGAHLYVCSGSDTEDLSSYCSQASSTCLKNDLLMDTFSSF